MVKAFKSICIVCGRSEFGSFSRLFRGTPAVKVPCAQLETVAQIVMAVLLDTSLGEFVIDLRTSLCPVTTKNFLKLCKYAATPSIDVKLTAQSHAHRVL